MVSGEGKKKKKIKCWMYGPGEDTMEGDGRQESTTKKKISKPSHLHGSAGCIYIMLVCKPSVVAKW